MHNLKNFSPPQKNQPKFEEIINESHVFDIYLTPVIKKTLRT